MRTTPSLLLCFGLLAGAVQALAAPLDPAEKFCGPPDYCTRTDRRVEPYPKTPPDPGSAGKIITDPNFDSRILRVTDANTDPARRNQSFPDPGFLPAEHVEYHQHQVLRYRTRWPLAALRF